MRVGILELLSGEARSTWAHKAYAFLITSQYASIMPQAVSVWCRELGHEVFYATYFSALVSYPWALPESGVTS